MARKNQKAAQLFIESEIGTIRKPWRGKISVVLVYPHRYHVGMSNLGFQTIYQLLNSFEHVVCERAFLPEATQPQTTRLSTLESDRPITDADIIAFSISFENDYPHLLSILEKAGIPLKSEDRSDRQPLVIAGGVACFLNPEPIAAYIDCFLIGEAEGILPRFFETFEPRTDKNAVLRDLARNVPGAYVPAFYQAHYHHNGTLAAFTPIEDAPPKIERVYLKDLNQVSTCSAIVTPNTTFERSFLIEIGRGCPHGCRFCSAGFVYRPPRFRSLSQLEQTIERGGRLTDRIGLV
ncbi:MAG: radical SAM protein, partial [Desulfobacterales bacterium]|nr:radical SAM protein [Desulfobacterales bacterium]